MSFDYSAWTDAPDPAAVKELGTQARGRGINPEGDLLGKGASSGGVVAGTAALITGVLGTIVGLLFLGNGGGVFAIVIVVILALFGVFGLVLVLRALPRYSQRWTKYYRAVRFARSNGLDFTVQRSAPEYPSMPFARAVLKRTTLYVFSRANPPGFEAGQLRNTTGSSKSSKSVEWGYITVDLDEEAPARVLVRSNSSENDGIVGPDRAALAGPASRLNDEFTQFCPPESAAVARSVFAAELLERLTALERHSGPLNVELIAQGLYVTAAKPFDMYDPDTVRLVFDTIAAAVRATAGPEAAG